MANEDLLTQQMVVPGGFRVGLLAYLEGGPLGGHYLLHSEAGLPVWSQGRDCTYDRTCRQQGPAVVFTWRWEQ